MVKYPFKEFREMAFSVGIGVCDKPAQQTACNKSNAKLFKLDDSSHRYLLGD